MPFGTSATAGTMKDTGKSKPAANETFIAVTLKGFTTNESAPAPEGTNPSPEETDAFPGETKPSPEGTMGEASLPSAHPGERRGEASVSSASPEGRPGERFVINGETFASKASSGERRGESSKTKEEAFERKVEDFVVSGQGFKTKGEGALPFASFRQTKEEGNGRKGVAGRRMAAYSQSSAITFVTNDPNLLPPDICQLPLADCLSATCPSVNNSSECEGTMPGCCFAESFLRDFVRCLSAFRLSASSISKKHSRHSLPTAYCLLVFLPPASLPSKSL